MEQKGVSESPVSPATNNAKEDSGTSSAQQGEAPAIPEPQPEKSSNEKHDFIKWFSELNKDSGNVAGGKGANLAEIYNLKIPVPPGFIVTAQAYDAFIKNAGLNEKIKSLLESIDYENTEQLTKTTIQIRELIESSDFPEDMKTEILEAYDDLGAGDESQMKGMSAHTILKKPGEKVLVAVRSSATTEDLAEASFAGQQDTFLNVEGGEDLLIHIKKAFSSLFTPRATYYRNKQGFKHEQASLAAVVQKMVDADKSGVIFSKDPATNQDHVVIEAVFGLGEGIVSGRITPDRHIVIQKGQGEFEITDTQVADKKIAIIRGKEEKKEIVKLKEEISKKQVLKEYEIKKLAEIALKLENHYKKPQDIEFAIEKENIYIVQTRPVTTIEKRAEVGQGRDLKGEVILTGLAASPGIGSGKIKVIQTMEDLKKISQGDILVTKMTNPDMVVTMQKSAAIVTDEGGLTAHAAIVSREMGIPAVVGTREATTKLREGEIITVNGFTGKIYKGKVAESEKKEIRKVSAQTRTKIKVILDLPSFAERAARTGLEGVGLARIEGIIAESGKHPKYFLENNQVQEYEEIIFQGIEEIAENFQEIWVRTSDIRTDEFKNLEGSPKTPEANPMLGMHGIRYSLKHPEILKAELKAMKRVSDKGKKIGILSPQVISVEEIKKLKEFVREVEFKEAKVGVMIETPASVQIIEELCDEGIDFVSFGTNDLTQYTLAIDRGNSEVQDLYNELNPAILHQLEKVLNACQGKSVETSICGQAGSKKEMVKFLVGKGINSISVNADMASDITDYVAQLESSEGAGSEANLEQRPGKAAASETSTAEHGRGVAEGEKEEPEEEFVKPQNTIQEEPQVSEDSRGREVGALGGDAVTSNNTPPESSEEQPPAIRGSEYIEKEETETHEKEPEKGAVVGGVVDSNNSTQTQENPEKEGGAPTEEIPQEETKPQETPPEKTSEEKEDKEETLDIF